jgi:hypothetical protein
MCCCRYGYQYDCMNSLRPEDDGTSACSLALQSFRGCPCSDAVGRQKEYQEIMQRAWPCRCSHVSNVVPRMCSATRILSAAGDLHHKLRHACPKLCFALLQMHCEATCKHTHGAIPSVYPWVCWCASCLCNACMWDHGQQPTVIGCRLGQRQRPTAVGQGAAEPLLHSAQRHGQSTGEPSRPSVGSPPPAGTATQAQSHVMHDADRFSARAAMRVDGLPRALCSTPCPLLCIRGNAVPSSLYQGQPTRAASVCRCGTTMQSRCGGRRKWPPTSGCAAWASGTWTASTTHRRMLQCRRRRDRCGPL